MPKVSFIFLISLFAINSHCQKLHVPNFIFIESLPEWIAYEIDDLNFEKDLVLDNNMNPFYLESDFNGDEKLDIAFCVTDKSSKKKGILIIHGGDFQSFLIGAGNDFAHVGNDFKFLELWRINRNRKIELTEFSDDGEISGTKPILIENDAIWVSKSESAPNIIAWLAGSYVWLHTGD